MAREELISSAVTFLQDPSVSSAPIEKKVAFLQSKNLTQEEIDAALARVGESSSAVATTSQTGGYAQQQQYRPVAAPVNQSYGYGQVGQWQAPPPELPKRDWRDWFIMATVMGGVGYGLYFVAKRYITPLIAPPTPPQLQQDKESIDEQFSRAFALLDQLAADTADLKAAEDARTERLDTALREVEDVVAELKTSSRRRDDETRRISDEVKGLKDGIPRAIEGAREGNEKRLKELGAELKSLKVLLSNRLGSNVPSPVPATIPRPATVETPSSQPAPSAPQQPAASSAGSTPAAPQSSAVTPSEKVGSPFSQLGKPASIPAWQMAAAKSTATPSTEKAGNSSASTENQQACAPPS